MDVTHSIMLDLSSMEMEFRVLEELQLMCIGSAIVNGEDSRRHLSFSRNQEEGGDDGHDDEDGGEVENRVVIGVGIDGNAASEVGLSTLNAFLRAPRLVRATIIDNESVYNGQSYSSCIQLPWYQLCSLSCTGKYLPHIRAPTPTTEDAVEPSTSSIFPQLTHFSILPSPGIASFNASGLLSLIIRPLKPSR
ncbi:hypothetical protein BT96DRAFT_516807 [Gymnopus androsaceus JB14]|uniref:Uncharacterized protein n=1 Tax=Gymnopus androsaceus JB14 TaxID=1447944 RepID=A0A6A4HWQ7_9AGAR|nr:hypothetical protein BT96DRAFT_516807 [Gymnopus androsaceus JB14]